MVGRGAIPCNVQTFNSYLDTVVALIINCGPGTHFELSSDTVHDVNNFRVHLNSRN